MTDEIYLKRLFQAYYKEKKDEIPLVNLLEHREFGYIPWEKQIMIRHLGFNSIDILRNYLVDNAPKHLYSSGSLYIQPDNPNMDNKGYQGCDFIVDIDVDHFYTPCKDNHDIWYCKECEESGMGMPPKKCPKCGKKIFKGLAWICNECLEVSKKEIIKLIKDFLIPDFNIKEKDMKLAFSGHRGFHLKIENKKIRTLSSAERREIVDYLTGNNISFEILGLKQIGTNIYGLLKDNIGWSKKIITKMENILQSYSNIELEHLLKKFGLNKKIITSFLNSKNDFLEIISKSINNMWNIEGFGLKTWETFLTGIISEIGVELDEPVSIDIHRLIRYPGSLHGKTGFKVQELTLKELETFNPLDETNEKLDPIVFQSEKVQKLEVIEQIIPATKIKGNIFGPFSQGEKIEVPHHVAVFLLCKGVAKTI